MRRPPKPTAKHPLIYFHRRGRFNQPGNVAVRAISAAALVWARTSPPVDTHSSCPPSRPTSRYGGGPDLTRGRTKLRRRSPPSPAAARRRRP